MTLLRILSAGLRGRNLANVLLSILVLALALGGYLFKTPDEGRDAAAAAVEAQIQRETVRIRMLRAEISALGEPGRIAELSRRYLNLGPLDPAHDIAATDLPRIAALAAAAPASGASPPGASPPKASHP
jgi:hypothetical protein